MLPDAGDVTRPTLHLVSNQSHSSLRVLATPLPYSPPIALFIIICKCLDNLKVWIVLRLDLVCELDGDDNHCAVGFPFTLKDEGRVVRLETVCGEEHCSIKNVLGEDGSVAAKKTFPALKH